MKQHITSKLSAAAFLLGAFIVAWMAAIFIGSNPAALLVTLLIAAGFLAGYGEMLHFQHATRSLSNRLNSLEQAVDNLDSWLKSLPPSLHNSVRLRIEGEHIGLPAPVLTPWLVGFLVMLGLLGTFIGMIDTLKGAVSALEGSSELEAIRAGLAAPIKGLGIAFGTSVAGVAASAMLGFIAALSRRDRIQASRLLDDKIQTVFRAYSLAYNRKQTYQAMQQQANALPHVAEQLTELGERLASMSENIGQQLLANQQALHQSSEQLLQAMVTDISQAVKQHLADSSRLTVESIQPATEKLMQNIQQQSETSHQQLSKISETQLLELGKQLQETGQQLLNQQSAGDEKRLTIWQQRFTDAQQQAAEILQQSAGRLAADWQKAGELAQQQQQDTAQALQQAALQIAQTQQQQSEQTLERIHAWMNSNDTLTLARRETEARWMDDHNARIERLSAILSEQLGALQKTEQQRSDNTTAQLALLQENVGRNLATLGQELQAPMDRLMATASEAPKAAAEVIEQLRAEIANNLERDNELLSERHRIMGELNELSGSMEQASKGQREALEQMVNASSDMLKAVLSRFDQQVNEKTASLSAVVDHFSASATDLASMGDGFHQAVQLFDQSNQQLLEKLHSIEQTLQQSGERSDEQLAYYVAQAREIIDYNIMSQQEMIDRLRADRLASAKESA